MNEKQMEQRVGEIGQELLAKARAIEPSLFAPLWWERQVIGWITQSPAIKTGALRFLDVFPTLVTGRAVTQHLREYLPKAEDRLPPSLRLGGAIATTALSTPGAASLAAGSVIRKIARNFIIGIDMTEAETVIGRLQDEGMSVTLDLLGEATLSDMMADLYRDRYIDAVNRLAAMPKALAPQEPPQGVSVKLSALTSHFSSIAPHKVSADVRSRLRPIVSAAMEKGVFVTIDMESYLVRDLTIRIFTDLLDEDVSDFEGIGIAIQSYLMDAEESLDEILKWAKKNRRRIGVRLVKGAYWEQEQVLADQRGWLIPVRMTKGDTDASFERMTRTLFDNVDHLLPAIASHNIRSLAHAIAYADQKGLNRESFEVQALYGMGDEIKKALLEMGVQVRVYAPMGEMVPGMAYLVRRILENSSQESFLRQSFLENVEEEKLLEKPEPTERPTAVPQHFSISGAEHEIFVNEPGTPFHKKEARELFDAAIEQVAKSLGREYPLAIDGSKVTTGNQIVSVNPSDPSQVIGNVHAATVKEAGSAMDSAASSFARWRSEPPRNRLRMLSAAADIIRERKFELAAWQAYEVGKTREEAMGDIDEAIDHITFYASAGLEVFRPVQTQSLLGESNQLRHVPLGPGIVIAPWNFPLAILAGLTCSALSAGNTVVIKPSSLAPVSAALFVDILKEAGLPDGVVNFLPGRGEEIGSALMNHSATTFINFTGSYAVGAGLVQEAARLFDKRNRHIKVVAEMGGKNAIIVDSSADLDEAVAGVIGSAFGFGGQKCSACSRVIVMDDIYGQFVQRLEPAVRSLRVGNPLDPAVDYGPLIDEAALRKAKRYADIGRKEAIVIVDSEPVGLPGYFLSPMVFGDVDPRSSLAQEEIFGPLLSLIRAHDIKDAVSITNDISYALTGGIYSRTPSSVACVTDHLDVGNLYVNRGITGAVVGRQPFGGHKRSGLGSAKAGSIDLVRELTLPQVVTENIVRHGFSPDLE